MHKLYLESPTFRLVRADDLSSYRDNIAVSRLIHVREDVDEYLVPANSKRIPRELLLRR